MAFFTELDKPILKFIWKHKTRLMAKAILSKKSNGGGISKCTTEPKQNQHGGLRLG
jgi:hypothetical protein